MEGCNGRSREADKAMKRHMEETGRKLNAATGDVYRFHEF